MLTEYQKRALREVQWIILHLLNENNKEEYAALEKRVREHPEEFSEEFLKDFFD